jgi:hypothetical protein
MAAFFRCLRLGGEAIEVCGALIADQRATVGLATGTLRRGSQLEPRENAVPTLAAAGIAA